MAVDSLSPTRITSLYSGLDTDALVTNALSTEQSKLDKLFQNKEKATWRLDAYSEIYASVNSLRTNYLSVLGNNSVIKGATYNAYTASITQNTALSVTATETALPGAMNITKTEMATAAGVSALSTIGGNAKAWGSGSVTTPEGGVSGATTIGDLAGAFGLESGEELSFSVNGKTYSFAQDKTLGDIKAALAEDGINWEFSMTEDSEAGTTAISSTFTNNNGETLKLANITGKAFGSEGVLGAKEGTHTAAINRSDTIAEAMRKNGATEEQIAAFTENGITVNGKNIKFDAEKTTLRSMMNTINTDTEANATFSYSEITGKFSIESSSTGADSALYRSIAIGNIGAR